MSRVVFCAALLTGCGLSLGGPDLPASGDDGGMMDASADLNVEDRGTMMNDSGMTCECVPKDAENDGWSYIGAQPAKVACPTTDYAGMPAGSYVWNPQAMGYGCACSCTPTPPTCTIGGTIKFQYGLAICLTGAAPTCTGSFTSGTCANCDPGALNGGGHLEQTVKVDNAATPQGGSCAQTVTPSKGTIGTSDAQICGYSGAKATCMSGDACLVAPPSPFSLCVAKPDPTSTITTCPNGFPKGIDGTSAGPTHLGTMTDDSAVTCPSCNCAATTACDFNVDVYDNTCTNGNKLFTAGLSCASDGQGTGGFHPKSIVPHAAGATKCVPSYTTTMATGTPQVTGTITAVCCR